MIDNKYFLNNSIESFLECIENKKLILFGAGNEMMQCLEKVIKKYDIDIAYLVDNDFRKWYSRCFGYEIKEPESLRQENADNIVILITSIYPFRIEEQLIRMKVKYYFSSLLFLERHIENQQFMVFF